MPITRLNEQPTREATLADITCDSDGQVNKFIDLRDVRDTLPLHPLCGGMPIELGWQQVDLLRNEILPALA